jgi:hypothetical protein
MMSPHDVTKPRLINVGVNLRRSDISVPQQFLDDPQICPPGKHVRCKGMPQHVGMDILHPSMLRQAANDLPDGHPFERATRIGKQQDAIVSTVFKPRQSRPQVIEVTTNRDPSRLPYWNKSFALTLAQYTEHCDSLVITPQTKSRDFRGSQACCIHEFQHGAVALPEPT